MARASLVVLCTLGLICLATGDLTEDSFEETTLTTVESPTVKKNHHVTGGVEKISADNPQLRAAILEIMDDYWAGNPESNRLIIVDAEAIRTIVNGYLYEIKVKLARSICSREIPYTRRCQSLTNEPLRICSITILVKPWLKSRKIDVNCS